MTSRRLLVVMPAYNEEACVAGVVKEVLAARPDADLVVVDDGSRDRTRELAQEAGAQVLSLPYNLGVGGAMRTGFRYADRLGYDVVVQVDADGQHDPREIETLLQGLDGADLVVGARFAGRGDYLVRGPRKWAMRLLAWSLSRATKTRLTDTTSGFRAFSRPVVTLFARQYPVEYLGDTVEALVVAARSGYRVRQVPVHMRPRAGGTPSQSPAKATVYLLRAGLALLLARIRR